GLHGSAPKVTGGLDRIATDLNDLLDGVTADVEDFFNGVTADLEDVFDGVAADLEDVFDRNATALNGAFSFVWHRILLDRLRSCSARKPPRLRGPIREKEPATEAPLGAWQRTHQFAPAPGTGSIITFIDSGWGCEARLIAATASSSGKRCEISWVRSNP